MSVDFQDFPAALSFLAQVRAQNLPGLFPATPQGAPRPQAKNFGAK